MNTYEQSDQGPYCLQYRPPKKISRRRADNKGKGLRQERKIHARIQRAGTGGLDPPYKMTKNIWFLSNTGPDLLKITKLPSQHTILGHHRHARETPFKWGYGGRPMMARL